MTEKGSSPLDALAAVNDKVREACKWLTASAGAVGAALLAGAQFSSIGQLPVGWPTDLASARLWIALVSAVLAFAAVGYVLWSSARLLLPVTFTVKTLSAAVTGKGPVTEDERSEVLGYLTDNNLLQGFPTPAALLEDRAQYNGQLEAVRREVQAGGLSDVEKKKKEDQAEVLLANISDRDQRGAAIQAMAQSRLVDLRARKVFNHILAASLITAVGIAGFTWAANPPKTTVDLSGLDLSGANLRDADLTNADLSSTDLTDADLTGANLSGANTDDVVWSSTVCPDGKNSDEVEMTCAGHLG